MSETSLSPKRPRLDYDDSSGKEDHFDKYKNREREHDEQSSYSQSKHRKRSDPEEEDGKEEDGKTKTIAVDTARREHTLVMRLTNKEQELQDCMNQIQEMKQAQTQNTAQLRSMLLDPAINLVFQRMAKEMEEHKEKLKQKQNELSAGKFTRDSQIGRRMMTRCRLLLQENTELGKMISSGRTARLEGEIVLHKALVTEMKKNQKELDEFVGELEEDVEGMQGMIFMLQQQLKEAREQIARLQQENEQLRTLRMPPDPEPGGEMEGTSNSNTPIHDWPAETGPEMESDNAASSLLSPSVYSGRDVSNGTASESLHKRSSPVIPPALSALSGKNKMSTTVPDNPSTALSTDEDLSSLTSTKMTPNSGMQLQNEDLSMDTLDFAASPSQQQRQQHCDSEPLQKLSDPETTNGNPVEPAGKDLYIKKEIVMPKQGAERTTSNTVSAVSSNAANSVPDGNMTAASTLLSVTKNSSDSTLNCLQTQKESPSPTVERTIGMPNNPAAICTTPGIPLINIKEPKEMVDDSVERTSLSNTSKNDQTLPILSTENDKGQKIVDEEVKEENTTINDSLGLNVAVKMEDDKSECQARLSLVNGSSALPGQGL